MIPLQGHQEVRATLENTLPPTTLLRGAPSIGKWTLTHHLAAHHNIAMIDRLSLPDGLRVEQVRHLHHFAATAPFGRLKLFQARIDASSEAALHTVLKILEEPPPYLRILLCASQPILSTITGRCRVYPLHGLNHTQLVAVLRGHGLGQAAADLAATIAPGRVRPALLAAGNEATRQLVINLLRALATGDALGLHQHLAEFDEPADVLLIRALTEAATGHWRVYRPTELPGTTTLRARQMLAALAVLPEPGRPRLAATVILRRFLHP